MEKNLVCQLCLVGFDIWLSDFEFFVFPSQLKFSTSTVNHFLSNSFLIPPEENFELDLKWWVSVCLFMWLCTLRMEILFSERSLLRTFPLLHESSLDHASFLVYPNNR